MGKIHTRTHRYATRSSQGYEAEYNLQNQGIVSCRKRKKSDRSPPFLPKDIILKILLLLPAKVLQDVVRYVCKEWHSIVKDPAFVTAHFPVSSNGVIVQDLTKLHVALYIETGSSGFRLTEFKLPFSAKVSASCDGLVLLHDKRNDKIFHVVNLVTKTKVTLPPLVHYTAISNIALSCTSSHHYKVVYVSRAPNSQVEVMICTIGADRAWRTIDLSGTPVTESVSLALLKYPQVIARFIYWNYLNIGLGFALDVDAETFHQFPFPKSDHFPTSRPFYLSMERRLGFVSSPLGNKIWDVWELTDLKSGKWTKVVDLNKVAISSRIGKMLDRPRTSVCIYEMPAGILKNGELWLQISYDKKQALVCYNLKSGVILLHPFEKLEAAIICHSHTNSLLWLRRCQ